jgi:hypothetical protein
MMAGPAHGSSAHVGPSIVTSTSMRCAPYAATPRQYSARACMLKAVPPRLVEEARDVFGRDQEHLPLGAVVAVQKMHRVQHMVKAARQRPAD